MSKKEGVKTLQLIVLEMENGLLFLEFWIEYVFIFAIIVLLLSLFDRKSV